MSRTAMGIDHLRATGQPDPNITGAQLPVPPEFIGRWAQAPLGFIHVEPASQVPFDWQPPDDPAGAPVGLTGAGDQKWIYVYAVEDLAVGTVVTRSGLTDTPPVGAAVATTAPDTSAPAAVLGVAQYEILQGFFGFILRTGPGVVTYGNDPAGAAAGGFPLIMDATTDGQANEGTFDQAGFGVSMETPGAGPLLGTAILACTG